MAERFLIWIGTGLLAAGVSASALAGAGVAASEEGGAADPGGQSTSSESAETGVDGSNVDPGPEDADPDEPENRDEPEDPEDPGEPDEVSDPEDESEPEEPGNDKTGDDSADDGEQAGSRGRDRENAGLREQDLTPSVHTADQVVEVESEGAPEPALEPVVVEPEPSDETVTVAPIVDTEPDTAIAEPDVVETIAEAVSSVDTTVMNPFASGATPATPAAQSQMWTLLAAARKEFETAFDAPALTEQAVAAENSLTYTPDLAFQDRIALLVHEVFRVITRVTGFDVTGALGRILSTAYPPFFFGFGLNSTRTTWTADDGTEWTVWEFRPPEPTEKKVVVLHGGGYILRPTVLHWFDYTNMARETGATVVVPLYPLATTPDGAATEVIPETADFIAHHIELSGAENVSIYADSAGVSHALGGMRELLLSGRPAPARMVLISGVMDSSLQNPDIRDVDDPIFDSDNLAFWDSHWYDGIDDRRDPLVSPLFFEDAVLRGLPPTTIYVGEREILYPDTLLMYERAAAVGAPISVVVGTGLLHGWPISGLPLYTQTAAVRPDIYRQLGLIGEETV